MKILGIDPGASGAFAFFDTVAGTVLVDTIAAFGRVVGIDIEMVKSK